MESTMMEKKKPDADGDGVPDWADKKPGKDDNEGKKKGSKPKKGEVPPQFQKESVKEAEEAKMPSKAEVMKCCKDGMSASEICKKYPDCDQDKLKELCKDCKAEMKEKTDESVASLSDSLKQKLYAVMETSEEVAEASEEELDEEEELNEEPVAEQEEVTEDESLDEMAELLKMAGLDEGTASPFGEIRDEYGIEESEEVNNEFTEFNPKDWSPEMASAIEDILSRNDGEALVSINDALTSLMKVDADEVKKNKEFLIKLFRSYDLEDTVEEVAHVMEYDDDHHDAHDDDHDELEGDKVTKEIELDDKEHEAMKSLLKKLLDA